MGAWRPKELTRSASKVDGISGRPDRPGHDAVHPDAAVLQGLGQRVGQGQRGVIPNFSSLEQALAQTPAARQDRT